MIRQALFLLQGPAQLHHQHNGTDESAAWYTSNSYKIAASMCTWTSHKAPIIYAAPVCPHTNAVGAGHHVYPMSHIRHHMVLSQSGVVDLGHLAVRLYTHARTHTHTPRLGPTRRSVSTCAYAYGS